MNVGWRDSDGKEMSVYYTPIFSVGNICYHSCTTVHCISLLSFHTPLERAITFTHSSLSLLAILSLLCFLIVCALQQFF